MTRLTHAQERVFSPEKIALNGLDGFIFKVQNFRRMIWTQIRESAKEGFLINQILQAEISNWKDVLGRSLEAVPFPRTND